VVRSSITSPADIRRVIQVARAGHFNALFVQIRGRGDAYYLSDLEPRAEELDGQPADFDPLAYVLQLAHASGIQVHAWMNTCYVWGGGEQPRSPMHIVNSHPDWLARDAQNKYILKGTADCEGAFITPANLEARRHVHDVFVDVASRYDIDGIHFDYIRYANSGYDYSDSALTHFKSEMIDDLSETDLARLHKRELTDRLAYPHAFPSAWREFRRRQVTEMVASISQDVKAVKPRMVVSAAVWADRADALVNRGQDWNTWLANGSLDAVLPMAYNSSTATVTAQISDAVACARAANRFVYAGLGSWHIPAASTISKIAAVRRLGVQGVCLFSYGGITKDGATTNYVAKVANSCFKGSASVPEMPWMKADRVARNVKR
jgi:uncharacterized lipoprotein YddW (UPF0748 family)